MAGDKICKICKCAFYTDRPWTKLCSEGCQQQWRNEQSLKRYHRVKKEMCENIRWRMNKLCKMAEERSKNADLLFDITPEYLETLYEAQGAKCDISGRAFDLSYSEKRPLANCPSLDRIIPEYGYTKGNVRLTIYQVNVAIADYGLEAFLVLCEDVSGEF